MGERRRALEKKLSYRLPVGQLGEVAALQSMHDHWKGFTWTTGPVVVKWLSDIWPQVQVWASSEAEGRRVVTHALNHMGAEVADGEWQYATVTDTRYGRITTVRATVVSARNGPHGVAPKRWILGSGAS
jgi:hypothetical protein